jgi:hypothetical protein
MTGYVIDIPLTMVLAKTTGIETIYYLHGPSTVTFYLHEFSIIDSPNYID